MTASVAILKRSQWVVVLGAFALFIALQTYSGFFQSYNLGSDQQMVGIMALKQTRPELYTQDYFLTDDSLLRYYTPFYRYLTGWLVSFMGDYALALLVLLPAIMLVYLLGMFVLIYSVTGNIWIGVLISVVSSLEWTAFGGEVWGVANLRLVMPRAFFCALAPWLTILMFRWLQSEQWWHWPLLLLFTGLSANLHPVSGLGFAQLLLSIFVVVRGISKRNLVILCGAGAAAMAGVWPTLANFLRATSIETVSVPFASFHQVMLERIVTLFFSDLPPFTLFRHSLSLSERQILAWAYSFGLIAWGILYLLSRSTKWRFLPRGKLHGLLFALQLPIADLLTNDHATALVIIVAFYGIFRGLEAKLDRWNLGLLTLACVFSYLGAYFFGLIWARFELYSLTSFMAEQPRISRFVYLPLFVFSARFLQATMERLPGKIGMLILASTVCLFWVAPNSILWSFLVGLVTLAWKYNQKWAGNTWIEVSLNVATWTLAARMGLSVLSIPHGDWLALCVGMLCSLVMIGPRTDWRHRDLTIGVSTALLILGAALSVAVWGPSWVDNFTSIPGRMWAWISPTDRSQLSEGRQAAFSLYDWAREQTKVDSLFYYDSLEFRFRAQRSITHCWKDIGAAYYTKVRLVEFYDRYQKLQRAYEDPARLLAYAREYKADYIVTTHAQGIQLHLPVAFENSVYKVYSVESGGG
jgi:hypothetical protein